MNFRTDKTVTMEDLASGKINYVWSYDEETNKITCKSKEGQDAESFSIIKISSTELVLSYAGKGYSVAVVTYLKRVD